MLLPQNNSYQYEYQQQPWLSLFSIGYSGFKQLGNTFSQELLASVIGLTRSYTKYEPTGSSAPKLPKTIPGDWSSHVESTRVRNAPSGGFFIDIPLSVESARPFQLYRELDRSWYDEDMVAVKNKLEAVMPGMFDPTKTLDLSYSTKIGESSLFDPVLERMKTMRYSLKGVIAFRVISPAFELKLYQELSIEDVKSNISQILTSRTLHIYMTVHVSQEAAKFICQGRPYMSVVGSWFMNNLQSYSFTGIKSAASWVTAINPVSQITAKVNAAFNTRADKGLLTAPNGRLIWLPDVNMAAIVEQYIETQNTFTTDNGKKVWVIDDVLNPENRYKVENGVRKLRPKGANSWLAADWENLRGSYINGELMVATFDLAPYRRPEASAYLKYLKEPLSTISLMCITRALVAASATMEIDKEEYHRWVSPNSATSIANLMAMGKAEEAYYSFVSSYTTPPNLSLQESADVQLISDPTLNIFVTTSLVPIVRDIALLIKSAVAKAEAAPNSVQGIYTVMNTLEYFGTAFLVARYAGKTSELEHLDNSERAVYKNPPKVPYNQIKFDVPWLAPIMLFPHQARVWPELSSNARNIILDVAAGGGKTLLTLMYAAFKISQGIKYPLIICPETLIKNYVNDAQWAFQGRMNIVVLNNVTLNSPNWGHERLLELVKNAPVNTIFLTSYHFVIPRVGAAHSHTAMYGSDVLTVSDNTELLRSIFWGCVAMDESHKSKNEDGATNRNLLALCGDIPYKLQASGTYIPDTLKDVVGQYAIMNAQVFGSMEMFLNKYFSKNGYNMTPLPGSQIRVRQAMMEHSLVITVRRLEWGALLPERHDMFHPVAMTEAQEKTYLRVLAIQKEALLAEIKNNPRFASRMKNAIGEGDGADVAALIQTYLARIERYLTVPSLDPEVLEHPECLTGNDRVSPKIPKLIEILREHRAKKIYGKVLVWTQYIKSAEELFNSLPKDLQAHAVLYTAANKNRCISEFNTNPNVWIMVGVEVSMNTGENLQIASRIIRTEFVWNWGTLEQGESRINRPMLDDKRKTEAGGKGIHFDWIFVNNSIDVTKIGRMLAKLIATVKWYYYDNPKYQELAELPMPKMNIETIFSMNDWQSSSGCAQHFQAYGQYMKLEQEQFAEYLSNPNSPRTPVKLRAGKVLKGSGVLANATYIPQTTFWGANNIGLLTWVEYLSSMTSDDGIPCSEDPNYDPAGLIVHTESGDLEVLGFNRGGVTLKCQVPGGKKISIDPNLAWIPTKRKKRVRKQIIEQVTPATNLFVPTAYTEGSEFTLPTYSMSPINVNSQTVLSIDYKEAEENGLQPLLVDLPIVSLALTEMKSPAKLAAYAKKIASQISNCQELLEASRVWRDAPEDFDTYLDTVLLTRVQIEEGAPKMFVIKFDGVYHLAFNQLNFELNTEELPLVEWSETSSAYWCIGNKAYTRTKAYYITRSTTPARVSNKAELREFFA